MKIRKFTESDYQNLYETISDAEVMKYIELPYSEKNTKEFLFKAGLCDYPLIFAVEDDSGNYVGYVIYHDYDNLSIEIGWLLKRSEWGKGYAKELTKILINRAKSEGKAVIIECSPKQSITRHIAKSFGFKYLGEKEGLCVYQL